MPEQPYKRMEVVDHGGEAVATFTQQNRGDKLLTLELRHGVSIRVEARVLAAVAFAMRDDRLEMN